MIPVAAVAPRREEATPVGPDVGVEELDKEPLGWRTCLFII